MSVSLLLVCWSPTFTQLQQMMEVKNCRGWRAQIKILSIHHPSCCHSAIINKNTSRVKTGKIIVHISTCKHLVDQYICVYFTLRVIASLSCTDRHNEKHFNMIKEMTWCKAAQRVTGDPYRVKWIKVNLIILELFTWQGFWVKKQSLGCILAVCLHGDCVCGAENSTIWKQVPACKELKTSPCRRENTT